MTQPQCGDPDPISCPSCGASIPITEALHRQISDNAWVQLLQKLARERRTLEKRAEELDARELELKRLEGNGEAPVESCPAAERQRVEAEASAKARTEVAVELRDLRESVREKEEKLREALATEFQLRKEKRDLESEKRKLELRVVRTIGVGDQQSLDIAVGELEGHRLCDVGTDHKPQEAGRVLEELRRTRDRLVRWFDDAKTLRDLARRIGVPGGCAEIMAAFRRDIGGGPDGHLVHRIPLPTAPSAEEALYVFPDHRAIYEIQIPRFRGGRHHFIMFIDCDRGSGGASAMES